jgi:hypothetical protein
MGKPDPVRPGTIAGAGRGSMDMHSIEAVVTDLEWQRLRQRVGRHPNHWLVRPGAWAAIRLLKLIVRAGFFRPA